MSRLKSSRKMRTGAACVLFMLLALLGGALSSAGQESAPAARELRRIAAEEAHQGVATDRRFVYAIADGEIGKYDKASGKRVGAWKGDPAVFIHMNSCSVVGIELVCAMSNFPNHPMSSSVEWFSTSPLKHLRSHSFGPGRGSLTWIDWHDGSWWACFANYDGKGGEPPRDHTATVLVRFNAQFVEQESWLFPQRILESFGHMSASGGRFGRGGYLYVSGHDLPELYIVRLPRSGGSRLEYVGTIAVPTQGQAFDWDFGNPDLIWSIERKRSEVVESRLPPLSGP